MTTFHFHEFDIPVNLLNMTGGGIDTFEIISQMHMSNLSRFIGIAPEHNILGIGRDAIPLTKSLSPEGSYLGIDIIKPSIDFCTDNITAKYPNFEFLHLDVKDQLHNPNGVHDMVECKVPLADQSTDRIIAWSVFTHMYEVDIQHYTKEFKRILRPDGAAYLTSFVITDPILERARETNLTKFDLRFMHEIDPGCFVNNIDFPLGAIGYSPARWRKMVDDSGLKFKRDFLPGAWSGYYPEPLDGQDVLVLGV